MSGPPRLPPRPPSLPPRIALPPMFDYEVFSEGKYLGKVRAANGRGAYLAAIKSYNPDHRLALHLRRQM